MSWIDTSSDIDIEIANCYSQIEELENKIKQLKAEKLKEQKIDELTKQFRYKEESRPVQTIYEDDKGNYRYGGGFWSGFGDQ